MIIHMIMVPSRRGNRVFDVDIYSLLSISTRRASRNIYAIQGKVIVALAKNGLENCVGYPGKYLYVTVLERVVKQGFGYGFVSHNLITR